MLTQEEAHRDMGVLELLLMQLFVLYKEGNKYNTYKNATGMLIESIELALDDHCSAVMEREVNGDPFDLCTIYYSLYFTQHALRERGIEFDENEGVYADKKLIYNIRCHGVEPREMRVFEVKKDWEKLSTLNDTDLINPKLRISTQEMEYMGRGIESGMLESTILQLEKEVPHTLITVGDMVGKNAEEKLQWLETALHLRESKIVKKDELNLEVHIPNFQPMQLRFNKAALSKKLQKTLTAKYKVYDKLPSAVLAKEEVQESSGMEAFPVAKSQSKEAMSQEEQQESGMSGFPSARASVLASDSVPDSVLAPAPAKEEIQISAVAAELVVFAVRKKSYDCPVCGMINQAISAKDVKHINKKGPILDYECENCGAIGELASRRNH